MPSCCLKSGVCAVLLEHPSGGGNGGEEAGAVTSTRRENFDYHSPTFPAHHHGEEAENRGLRHGGQP